MSSESAYRQAHLDAYLISTLPVAQAERVTCPPKPFQPPQPKASVQPVRGIFGRVKQSKLVDLTAFRRLPQPRGKGTVF